MPTVSLVIRTKYLPTPLLCLRWVHPVTLSALIHLCQKSVVWDMRLEFCVHLLSQEGSRNGFGISSICSSCFSLISLIWLGDTPTCFCFVYCLFLHPHQHQVKQSLEFYRVSCKCGAQHLNPPSQQNRSSCSTSKQKNSPMMEASCEE